MKVEYIPVGVCSRFIQVSAEDGIVTEVVFHGGCNGNLQGVSRLVTGMKVQDAIDKLAGIDCGGRGTSCPDQLSVALRQLAGAPAADESKVKDEKAGPEGNEDTEADEANPASEVKVEVKLQDGRNQE